jgi:hypothetical protein
MNFASGNTSKHASKRLRPTRWGLLASSLAITLGLLALSNQAHADGINVTLCPGGATVGGINESSSAVSGPLDGTCGAPSAIQLSIPQSTDYAKLEFIPGQSGYPQGLTLSGIVSLSASVSFTTGGSDKPYMLLPLVDSTRGLGQANAGDQILLIEFQPATLTNVGTTLAIDASTTRFNVYDNTTNTYLLGGQQNTNTIDGYLALYPFLATDPLQGVWVAQGLTGGDTGPETLTVSSLSADYEAPEPASLALLGTGLAVLGLSRRKRAR